ncbi:uromodulin-like [Pelobates fuscus]|uniref:uromodulin-like n=1 Tax=Pelobates fuscus TaxID=191477 RepID=UPI002FE49C0E
MHRLLTLLILAGATEIVVSTLYSVGNGVSEVKISKQNLIDLCPKLLCGTSIVNMTFKKSELEAWKVNVKGISPVQGSCIPTVSQDSISSTVSWPLGNTQCGTILTVNATHATYATSFELPPDPTYIIYREAIFLKVSCSYPLDMITSLNTTLKPDLSVIHIIIDGTGLFKVSMTLFQDPSYSTRYPVANPTISTESMLYVDVKIDEGDISAFYLVMINCFATPTNSIYDQKKYDIIKDSCPNKDDKTIHVPSNGISSRGQFQVKMFKFIGKDYDYVFLHCEVHLCRKTSGSCLPDCTGRGSRSSSPNGKIVSIGPIQVGNSQNTIGPVESDHLESNQTQAVRVLLQVYQGTRCKDTKWWYKELKGEDGESEDNISSETWAINCLLQLYVLKTESWNLNYGQ